MSSAVSQSLINLLLESGVQSREEAAELALNLNGGSWVGQVLDSGKVQSGRATLPRRDWKFLPGASCLARRQKD